MCGRWIGPYYFQTKNSMNMGATTIFEIDPIKWTKNNIEILIEKIIPQQIRNIQTNEMYNKRNKAIFEKKSTEINFMYDPFSMKHILHLQIIVYPSTMFSKYNLTYRDDKIFLCFTTFIDNLHLTQTDAVGHQDNQYLEKIKFYLNVMEKAFDFFQPDFGWSDTLDNMIPYVKKDSREHIFGVNYYGLEMIKEIGKDRILNLSDLITMESNWGGMIVKLKENPFIDIGKELRQRYEKRIFCSNPAE